MTADILGDFHVEKEEVDESCSPMIAEPEEGEVEEFLECHKLGLSPGSSQVILWFLFTCAGSLFDRSVTVDLMRAGKVGGRTPGQLRRLLVWRETSIIS